ncbi:MAG: DUF2924 domain-containing protein [Rhodobacteraceae bacterium]|nr:DUF2924 domain-containing protein [Paracoccaceae bacterium]
MTPDEIETLDRAALCAAWAEVFGTTVPRGLSAPMMRRFLATEVQTRQHGGLPKRIVRALQQEAPTRASASPGLKTGGRLMREWNGVTHVVEVTGDGYLWNGARYRSLSAIAQAITGAHWSGPRFFGLAGGKAIGKTR